MTLVVGVAFKPLGKLYNYDATEFPDLVRHEAVIVPVGQTEDEFAFAFVQSPPHLEEFHSDDELSVLRPIARRASETDYAERERREQLIATAHRTCLDLIILYELPMKLLETEYSPANAEYVFNFTSDSRVDFRELVRDLASRLSAHVMMLQVSTRSDARRLTLFGPCGRPGCCSTFIREFEPISIKLVKDQDLSLNPQRFSGNCGKLMCCLKYEHDQYLDARRRMPEVGNTVMTPFGRAKVVDVNYLCEQITVQLETQGYKELKASEISSVPGCVRQPSA